MRLDPRMATGDEDVDLGVRRVRTADVGDGSGTIMHQTHLPLRTWFLAAHLVATHSNGISALQLQAKLEIGSYKAAWLLLHKLRRAMVGPERDALEGMIEVDETSIAYRTKHDPVAGGAGRSHDGKLLVVGAIECKDGGKPGRIRLSVIHDFSARSLKGFVATSTADGSTILTDAFSSYQGMAGRTHLPKTVGVMAAHVLLPWIHRVFANLKRLALGVYHGSVAPTCRRTSMNSSSDGIGEGTIVSPSTCCLGSG